MRNKISLLSLSLASLLLAGCDGVMLGDSDRYKEDFHYNYPLSAGGKLDVENFNGSIEISGWDQDQVDISGTKYASTEQRLSEMKIEVAASAGAVTIRTLRPLDQHGNAGARYIIRAPRGASLDRVLSSNGPVRLDGMQAGARVQTSNGPVRASQVRGAVDIETSNGPVDATGLSGPAMVRTSNGPIQLSMDTVREVRASTSNGPITLRVPSGAGAELRARTSNGPISTDFNLSTGPERTKQRLEGSIGAGGPLLDLSTSNGPIRIQKL